MANVRTAEVEHRIWQVVREIPHGQVATYGQIAELAGLPGQARLVGRVLSRLPEKTGLPWHRVLNASGRITNPNPHRQAERLIAEGVLANEGRVSLRRYRWQP